MSKILYIKANPKKDVDSFTFQVSELFIKKYKENNPNDEIEILDLYNSDIDFLRENDIALAYSGGSEMMQKYAKQFVSADKYVIATPMWNLGLPAIFKAYIDCVLLAGVTFKYGENGPKGLTKENSKLIHIVACGGDYSKMPGMGDKYLRVIMGFLGIGDIETIAIGKTSLGDEGKKQLVAAKEKAEKLAKEW